MMTRTPTPLTTIEGIQAAVVTKVECGPDDVVVREEGEYPGLIVGISSDVVDSLRDANEVERMLFDRTPPGVTIRAVSVYHPD